MSKSTPGPWSVSGPYADQTLSILAPQKESGWSPIIANIRKKSDQSYFEAMANARLIAAAPELLEFAEAVLRELLASKPTLDEDAMNRLWEHGQSVVKKTMVKP